MFTDGSTVSNRHVVAARAAAVIAAAAALGIALSPTTASAANYRDGTYTGVGTYPLPGGIQSEIGIRMTLSDNIVKSAEVVQWSALPVSAGYQRQFWGGARSKVVGKNIDSVNVGKTAGSSLTPKGFNNAISKIKSQARR